MLRKRRASRSRPLPPTTQTAAEALATISLKMGPPSFIAGLLSHSHKGAGGAYIARSYAVGIPAGSISAGHRAILRPSRFEKADANRPILRSTDYSSILPPL